MAEPRANIKIVKVSNEWGGAVRAVLRDARLHEIRVAEVLRMNRGMLHQYLSLTRVPNARVVQAINAAVGTLVGNDSARGYLDAQALVNGLVTADDQTLVRRGLAALELTTRVTPDLAGRFIGIIEALSVEKRRKLLNRLHRTHRSLLFDATAGRVQKETGLDALRPVFDESGISLDVLLDEGEKHATDEPRVWADLRAAIRKVIATQFPDSSASERFTTERTIEDAVTESLARLPISLAVKGQGPTFFFHLWQAYVTGRPFSWPIRPRPRRRKGN